LPQPSQRRYRPKHEKKNMFKKIILLSAVVCDRVRISVIITFFLEIIFRSCRLLYENIYSMVLKELITREGVLSNFFLCSPSTVAGENKKKKKKTSFTRF
jgi:hypothetical protein